jgi:hypothetical protein
MKLAVGIMLLGAFAALSSCSDDKLPAIPDPTVKVDAAAKAPLELVDISKLPVLASKGRFQDGATALGEPNQVAKDLVANGPNSIPFLIGKVEDETEMDRHVMTFWYQLYVGDMAHIILTDLFTDKSGHSTIPGFGWDEFLDRGDDEYVDERRNSATIYPKAWSKIDKAPVAKDVGPEQREYPLGS